MRPLDVQELQHAISESPNLDQSTIAKFRKNAVKVCAGLVVVDQVHAFRLIRKSEKYTWLL
jgi:hypothetical protein